MQGDGLATGRNLEPEVAVPGRMEKPAMERPPSTLARASSRKTFRPTEPGAIRLADPKAQSPRRPDTAEADLHVARSPLPASSAGSSTSGLPRVKTSGCPGQAPMSRARRTRPGSSIVAGKASAVTGPTPGTDVGGQHAVERRTIALMCVSGAAIRASTAPGASSRDAMQA